jgi:hypothetical protein
MTNTAVIIMNMLKKNDDERQGILDDDHKSNIFYFSEIILKV